MLRRAYLNAFYNRESGLEIIPLFFISVRSSPSDVNKGLEVGASMYLLKPVAYIELKMALGLNIGLPVRSFCY
jgi:DNA-binding response OmpR family regulator